MWEQKRAGLFYYLKGTVMQMERALIKDRLRASKVP